MTVNCPSQSELRAYSIGELPEEQSDVLFSHLGECQKCQQEISQFDSVSDEFVAQLVNAAQPSTNEPSFSSEAESQLAAAKAVAAFDVFAKTDPSDSAPPHSSFHQRKIPDSFGEYEIVKPIGSGGMGTVYLGKHNKLGRDVAIKFMADHRLSDPRMHGRFASEMQAIGRLKHPNIVTAYDAREVDGNAVLVTEFIDGLDVGQILKLKGALGIADAAKIAHDIAIALEYIDQQGLIHRDIKPSNVMISREGEIKLLDLGLARGQSNENSLADKFNATHTGQTIGTPDFVSPEQINDGRSADIRSDIYSLGCTLFKMLAGSPPFPNDKFATAFAKMTAHVAEPAPSLRSLNESLPDGLVRLVDRMLSKDPSQRPQRPSEVAQELAQYCGSSELAALVDSSLDGEQIAPRPPIKSVTQLQSSSPLPWIAIAGALLAGLLFVGAIAFWFLDPLSIRQSGSDSAHHDVSSNYDKGKPFVIRFVAQEYYVKHFDPMKAANQRDRESLIHRHMNGVWTFQSKKMNTNTIRGFDEVLFHNGRYQSRRETNFGAQQYSGSYTLNVSQPMIRVDFKPDDPYASGFRGTLGFRGDFALGICLVDATSPYPNLTADSYDVYCPEPSGEYELTYLMKAESGSGNELRKTYRNLFVDPAPAIRFFVGTVEKPSVQTSSFTVPDCRRKELNYLLSEIKIQPTDVNSANAIESDEADKFHVEFSLHDEAAARLEKATQENDGKRFVVVERGRIICSLEIKDSISGNGMITGEFDIEEATRVAETLMQSAKQ